MVGRTMWIALALGFAGASLGAVACATTPPPESPSDSPDRGEPSTSSAHARLPASLDQFFPPNTKGPVYLMEMFALEQPFTGIGLDLQQGDIEGAKANYSAFAAQWTKVASMVPEWEDRYRREPVEALGVALESGDPGRVGQAMGGVGEVCESCHAEYLIAAHQQYHWLRFDMIPLTDPVANDERVSYYDFMMRLAGSYTGIGNDLRQGQLDRAREHYQAFASRFRQMADTACRVCHDSPRAYFVDREVLQAVDRLGEALQADAPDAQEVQEIAAAIGNESCMKCHLVHMPAAVAQRRARR